MAEDRNLFSRANSDQTGGNFLLRQTNQETEALPVKVHLPPVGFRNLTFIRFEIVDRGTPRLTGIVSKDDYSVENSADPLPVEHHVERLFPPKGVRCRGPGQESHRRFRLEEIGHQPSNIRRQVSEIGQALIDP